MKAPDKIYLNVGKAYAETSDALEVATWDTKQWNDCVNIEYILKDAILEWADEQEKELKYGISADAYKLALDMLREKLESL